MRDRQHGNVTCESDEYDVIRKIVDWKSAHVAIRNTRNERPSLGRLLEMPERLPHLSFNPRRCKVNCTP
jgi:hypothetical protein